VAIYAGDDGQALDYGQFSISAAPPLGADTEKLESAIDKEIAALLDKGVGSQELADAKTRLAADAIKARDSLGGPAEIVGSGLATGSTLAQIQSWPERIAAVGAEDVLRAAKDVLQSKDNSVTGILLPENQQGAAGGPAPLPHQQSPAHAVQ